MRRVVIFGAGDFARTAWFYFTHDTDYEVIAFTVDDSFAETKQLLGLPVIRFSELEDSCPPADHHLFVAVGFKRLNKLRAEICERARAKGYHLATYVSSRAIVAAEISWGQNCFVLENNVIQPFVSIGEDVVLWSGNHIGHDVRIDDHCFVSSHVVLSGRVHVGERCFLGVNSCVAQGVTIASDCLVGAGAVILKNTQPGQVFAVKGTPGISIPVGQIEGLL
jgi:sugar O-acyltransferase (sialic acid O-acetyltransferase NeuD family)